MKKIIIIVVFTCLIVFSLFSINNKKIGVSRIYSPFEYTDPQFHDQLESVTLSCVSDVFRNEVYALDLTTDIYTLRKYLRNWNNNKPDLNEDLYSKVITELSKLDYCIFFEIEKLNVNKGSDFYDSEAEVYNFLMEMKVCIVDCKQKAALEEEYFKISFESGQEYNDVINDGEKRLSRKLKSYLDEVYVFKKRINWTKKNGLFIWFDAGLMDGIKPQNILIAYEDDGYIRKENTAVKIISSSDNESVGIILYSSGNLMDDFYFTKKQKINIELQLLGGFSFADRENNVQVKTDYFSFLPSVGMRVLIPVGVAFFRPGFQLDFDIFYLDNKVLIPISFETGCQGEFNIHRFELDAGFMIGAMFTPDLNSNYSLDSVIVRPYLHLSAMLQTSVKVFGEFGYKYVLEGNFYKDYQIDMKGMYLNFGIGINL